MMAGHKMPRTLFGGRIRTSTALLGLAFVGVLLLWLAVRPDPSEVTEEVVRVRTTRTTIKEAEKQAEEERKRQVEEVRRSYAPTPTATLTPTPTPTVPVKPPRKGATPGTKPATPGASVPPGVPVPPGESPSPSGTSDRGGGGLFGLRGDEPRPEDARTPSADQGVAPPRMAG